MKSVWLVENGDVFAGYGLRAVAGSRSEAVAAFWRGYVSASARWNEGAPHAKSTRRFPRFFYCVALGDGGRYCGGASFGLF